MTLSTAITAEEIEPPLGLVELCHHRWAIPVIAQVRRTGGSKLVTLINALTIPRATLSRTLDALIMLDFVMRNPGYGHPMRPEYLLTPFGEDVAPACMKLWDAILRCDLTDTAGKKWALPVLWAAGQGLERFTDLLACLPGLTPRALTLALTDLEEVGLLRRDVIDERPPGVRYTLTRKGRRLATPTNTLVEALRFDA